MGLRNEFERLTYIDAHGEESSFISDPLLEYLEDERRSAGGANGLTESAQMKDGLALECLFDDEVGEEPNFDGIIGRS